MSATAAAGSTRPRGRIGDGLLLAGLLLLWQAVGSWTEGMAITGPLATFAYAGQLVLTTGF